MSPNDVDDCGTDERIFDEERIEERSGVHDEVAEEDATATRDVARQFPQAHDFLRLDRSIGRLVTNGQSIVN